MDEKSWNEKVIKSRIETEDKIAEPGIIDKFTGIIAHPAQLFDLLSRFKPRATDWILPVIIFILIASVSEVLMLGNPVVIREKIDRGVKDTERQVEEGIADKRISREEGLEIIDKSYEQAERLSQGPPLFSIFVAKFFVTALGFFFTAFIFFFFMNFLFGEIYKFKTILVVLGLPFYIFSIGVLFQTIIALLTGSYIGGSALKEFLSFEPGYLGFVFGRIDPVLVWFGFVLTHGFIKMFKVKWRKWKIPLFFITSWIVFNSFFYYLLNKFSFLGMLING